MIAINRDAVVEGDFAEVFQGMLVEVEERVGRSQTAAVAVERTRLFVYGTNDQCEWDGDWPKMRDGRIVRTPEYFEFMASLSHS